MSVYDQVPHSDSYTQSDVPVNPKIAARRQLRMERRMVLDQLASEVANKIASGSLTDEQISRINSMLKEAEGVGVRPQGDVTFEAASQFQDSQKKKSRDIWLGKVASARNGTENTQLGSHVRVAGKIITSSASEKGYNA